MQLNKETSKLTDMEQFYESCNNMNQQCKVCNEPAAGFHFGAFTCEGCKSFFGRTYNNLSSISECKNNGECIINKKNRTSCKACRLRKCLQVGMSKSGSRYGRRSNWFKIHCLLQAQGSNESNQGLLGSNGSGMYPGLFHPSQLLASDQFLQARLNGFQLGHKTEIKSEENRHSSTDDSGGSSMEDPEEETSRSASALSYLRPPSSHQTPSPFSEKDFLNYQRNHKLSLTLPTSPLGASCNSPFSSPLSGNIFSHHVTPQIKTTHGFSATRPGLTPAQGHLMFLDPLTTSPWPTRTGGDLLLCSPAPGGIPEQEQPIDLSVRSHSSMSSYSPPCPSPKKITLDQDCFKDGLKHSTTPLDLTKRPQEVPQSG